MPVFAASTPMSEKTASSCARTNSGGTSCTAVTPTVFCAVSATTTLMPWQPAAANAFRSAWMPAPPPESEPAIVRQRGTPMRRTLRRRVARLRSTRAHRALRRRRRLVRRAFRCPGPRSSTPSRGSSDRARVVPRSRLRNRLPPAAAPRARLDADRRRPLRGPAPVRARARRRLSRSCSRRTPPSFRSTDVLVRPRRVGVHAHRHGGLRRGRRPRRRACSGRTAGFVLPRPASVLRRAAFAVRRGEGRPDAPAGYDEPGRYTEAPGLLPDESPRQGRRRPLPARRRFCRRSSHVGLRIDAFEEPICAGPRLPALARPARRRAAERRRRHLGRPAHRRGGRAPRRPSRPAIRVVEPFPDGLDPRVQSALVASGVTSLYRHQAEAWEAAGRGEHLIVTTGTASGKTLAFNLPVLDAIARDPKTRVLYLYPTKALAQDQARSLQAFGIPKLRAAIYDGDTEAEKRWQIRKWANAILSNPDMLHVGVLPHHDRWGDVLANLRYVVVDEAHVYRGVFGSHVGERAPAAAAARPRLRLPSRSSCSPRRRSPTRASSRGRCSAST